MNNRKGMLLGTIMGMFLMIHALQVYSEWDFPQPVVGDAVTPAYFDSTANNVTTMKQ